MYKPSRISVNAVTIIILIPVIYFSGGDSNVVKTDYFSSIAAVLFKNVIDFEVVDNYMFATNYVSVLQYGAVSVE